VKAIKQTLRKGKGNEGERNGDADRPERGRGKKERGDFLKKKHWKQDRAVGQRKGRRGKEGVGTRSLSVQRQAIN